MALIDKLLSLKDKWIELGKMIVDPSVIADNDRYAKLTKEYKDLEEIVEKHDQYQYVLDNIKSSEEVIATETDPEFKDMAKAELQELKEQKTKLDEEIKFMLIPKDPDDGKNIMMEIRAGTGGDEASIFAGDLYRMYIRFFESMNWRYEVVTVNEGTNGGYKEVAMNVIGADVYANLRFESGVHRVQRVPETESQGRVHTSAATVAVLPEPDEIDFVLNMADVKKDTYRSSGAGGQHVNKTESAVRLTHLPTNTVVECQEERSQIKNNEKALKTLRTKLYEAEVLKREQATAAERKSQISSGDRSAKIRTYNFPQGRCTDHRINLTLYSLNSIMNGEIADIISALKMQNNLEKLNQGIEQNG